jgi:hypothetical protein
MFIQPKQTDSISNPVSISTTSSSISAQAPIPPVIQPLLIPHEQDHKDSKSDDFSNPLIVFLTREITGEEHGFLRDMNVRVVRFEAKNAFEKPDTVTQLTRSDVWLVDLNDKPNRLYVQYHKDWFDARDSILLTDFVHKRFGTLDQELVADKTLTSLPRAHWSFQSWRDSLFKPKLSKPSCLGILLKAIEDHLLKK